MTLKNTCKFCGQEKKLIKAHIIPKNFYLDYKKEQYMSVDSLSGKFKIQQNGAYDKNILCSDCDGKILGKFDATDGEVIAAAKAARAHHFIQTLPGGYQMELNEDASNVSQGQKQLITIARAILADNKILILDEATSSVDTRTEIEIQKAMDNLMKGRTSFVIAHRLSTIRDADLILVMKDGDIIEQGNHDELLAANGFYANLYNSQFEDVVA